MKITLSQNGITAVIESEGDLPIAKAQIQEVVQAVWPATGVVIGDAPTNIAAIHPDYRPSVLYCGNRMSEIEKEWVETRGNNSLVPRREAETIRDRFNIPEDKASLPKFNPPKRDVDGRVKDEKQEKQADWERDMLSDEPRSGLLVRPPHEWYAIPKKP